MTVDEIRARFRRIDDEIGFGRDHPEHPRLTHYILTCRKRGDAA